MHRPFRNTLKSLLLAGGLAIAGAVGAGPALSAEAPPPPRQEWAHGGVNSFFSFFKTFDRAQLQRGLQVYKEVCSSCHGLDLVAYRNLTALGYTEDEVKAFAAQYEVTDGPNDEGEMFTRPAVPADRFRDPFPNAKAAAFANNGKAPPDLSLLVKARGHYEDYVYGVLTGYREAPAGFQVPEGGYYNEYFPGHVIAMAPPLWEDGITYTDGTPATVSQQAKDVTAFMAWAAEPHLEARRRMGVGVIIFLTVLAGLLFAAKRRVWADVH